MTDSKQTTKNLFWLLSFLAILPFFLMIVFFASSSGTKGKAIQTGTISLSVSKENGKVVNPIYEIPFQVTKDGYCQFELAWECDEPGFITGCVVKNPDGSHAFALSAFSITGYVNQVQIPSGSASLEYHFMTTAEEVRRFCSEYADMTDKQIEEYLGQIDFATFPQSSEREITLQADVYELKTVSAMSLYGTILSGVLALLLLFLLYGLQISAEKSMQISADRAMSADALQISADRTMSADALQISADRTMSADALQISADRTMSADATDNGFSETCPKEQSEPRKERIGKVGLRHTIFVMAVTVTQIAFLLLLRIFAPDIAASLGTNLTFLSVILSVDVIGCPIAFLLYKNVPAQLPSENKLGLKNFFLFVLMGAGLCGVGGIVGNIIHNLVTAPFGGSAITVGDIIFGTDMPLRILAVGILAPIFEELVFRKLLIDHLYRYGEFIAILASGLTFGLFHGNFQQAIFATLLGFLWAFVYVRTGKIQYTMAMHMIINLCTSAITVYLLGKYVEYGPSDPTDVAAVTEAMQSSPNLLLYTLLYGGWMLFLILFGLAGAIVSLVFLSTGRFKLRRLEGEPEKKVLFRELLSNKYMWLFYLACLGLFLVNYLPVMLQ